MVGETDKAEALQQKIAPFLDKSDDKEITLFKSSSLSRQPE